MKRYIRSAEGLEIEERQKLAETSRDPKELARLANDENGDVRYGVAENPNTPAEVLAQLANDADRNVRQSAMNNPNCQ